MNARDRNESSSALETDRFLAIIRADAVAWPVLERARDAHVAGALPTWRLVSGALYNAVWNALDGQPAGYGVKDADLAYFDGADLSYEAEDRVIRSCAPYFEGLPVPVEVRNQARVHLWYEAHFGRPCPAYRSIEHAMDHYATRAHAVGLRLHADGSLDLYAPFGVGDLFARRLVPNRALDNRETHEKKGARIRELWPSTIVEPW